MQDIIKQKQNFILLRPFTDHPAEAGETYFEHLRFTLMMSSRLIYTTLALLLHGLFPFLCTHTASKQITRIWDIVKARSLRQKSAQKTLQPMKQKEESYDFCI